MISIIVPCYNEEEAIPFFYEKINEVIAKMKKVKFELIFVDDGSKDNTLKVLNDLSKKDSKVKYISFSRNFGKEAAMFAGLEKSRGDYVTIIDADLQQPPELLIELYENIEDYDCVALKRTVRKDESKIRGLFSNLYYKIINKISSTKIEKGASDFRLMSRQMVDAILELKEKNRYSKGIFSWVGFNTKWLEYENVERVAGKSKWSFKSLFNYATESIVSFSDAPLKIAFTLFEIFTIISMVLIIVMAIRVIMDLVITWILLFATILTFIAGLQFLVIGIMGLYISRIYIDVQNRPIYIIKETNIK